ncbi:tryptophan 2,3-dioxygenase [Sphingomicrobium clamense]|uniref:Tryptophan 2,3-dioxygenase n=1 Tax=Sphingomicrobium clamense TaxID=2851013 RepID=A0ABS6V2T9_9SPHN|nr:tryptophan 2,3-dioxygenase family protein [Sphingomicrobium sp. B8]MBW0143877.1 tryptophan 2,3-dioxygenase [Sphingomicrobium sp. B8]
MTVKPAGISYADYLDLDTILGAQAPHSELHDEMLFIIIHQNKELWLKQLLHELAYAIELLREDNFTLVHKTLSRVHRIQAVMTLSWDVLTTLTPVDYMKFRHVLGTSSGFQSAQFREFEYRLGIKNPVYLKNYEEGSEVRQRMERALEEPSLADEATAALARHGFDVSSEEQIAHSWLTVYRNAEDNLALYGLAEKLVDLDEAMAAWRHRHVLMVERVIGMKTGTGGSAGAPYLRETLTKRAFPVLWNLRTEI